MTDCLATAHLVGLSAPAMRELQAALVVTWPVQVDAPAEPIPAPVEPSEPLHIAGLALPGTAAHHIIATTIRSLRK